MRRLNSKTGTEIEGGIVEREPGESGPEIELVSLDVAVETVEDALADIHREAAVARVGSTVERAGTSPLVASNEKRHVIALLEDGVDGYPDAKGGVVQLWHDRGPRPLAPAE